MSGRWSQDEVDDRWCAVNPDEREAWLRFGTRPAPWENAPDFAERILKGDPNLTLQNAATLTVVFRSAYDSLVGAPPETT